MKHVLNTLVKSPCIMPDVCVQKFSDKCKTHIPYIKDDFVFGKSI